MALRILLVEDEESLLAMLRYNFEAAGHVVDTATDGEEAALLAEEGRHDIIILDWMLPGVSGIELCRRFRQREETRDIPIIMLTARGEESDRVRGLQTGADDYVVKPFSVPELMARVQALMRRAAPQKVARALWAGPLRLERDSRQVFWNDVPIPLSRTEWQLLEHLMQHPGRIHSRDQLLDAVWGMDAEAGPRTVDVAIARLRKALTQAGAPKDIIRTHRGMGYALQMPPKGT